MSSSLKYEKNRNIPHLVLSYKTFSVLDLFIIFSPLSLQNLQQMPLVLVSSNCLWTFSNKMIWISASKALPFTFAVFVVSAFLKGLFVVPRLSYESTSSLKELLEVSTRPCRTSYVSLPKSNTLHR
ncbi:hypothetical protein Tco_0073879 [Tanacetum coccineum]